MPALRDPQVRLDALIDAAMRVFARVGFARAQIADIAREADVSVGTVYNYVEGKNALVLLCAARVFGLESPPATALPVAGTAPETLSATAEANMHRLARLPALERALDDDDEPVEAATELRAIVAELYELVAATREGVTALERSAADLPELADVFASYGRIRRRIQDQLTTYLHRRISEGHLRPVPDIAASARFIITSTTWFARHRHHETDLLEIEDETARATVVELVPRALLPCHEAE